MTEPSTPTGGRSVFLSYAQEDAETAHRIKEALSASGIGVCFERGGPGDTGPSEEKIRGQIRTCALFIPIISQRAEACPEGGFRRERKLAVERTRHLSGSRTFIVPVVIDQTVVPEELIRYRWMRLADGKPTPEWIAEVKSLLEAARRPALKVEHAKPPTLSPFLREAAAAQVKEAEALAAARQRRSYARWAWGALVVAIIAVAVVFGLLRE